jgi:hypothetical protein
MCYTILVNTPRHTDCTTSQQQFAEGLTLSYPSQAAMMLLHFLALYSGVAMYSAIAGSASNLLRNAFRLSCVSKQLEHILYSTASLSYSTKSATVMSLPVNQSFVPMYLLRASSHDGTVLLTKSGLNSSNCCLYHI